MSEVEGEAVTIEHGRRGSQLVRLLRFSANTPTAWLDCSVISNWTGHPVSPRSEAWPPPVSTAQR
jgi:hypothetical protein